MPEIKAKREEVIVSSLWDHHGHLSQLGAATEQIDFRGVSSLSHFYSKLEEGLKNRNKGEWVSGFGWDQNKWEKKTTLKEIDKIAPDNPIFLVRIDYHSAIVNSLAIRESGLNNSSTIEGGFFEKVNGELTGVAVDKMMEKIASKIKEPSISTKKRHFKKATKILEENFLSGATDMMLTKSEEEILSEMDRKGEIDLPLLAFLKFSKGDEFPSKLYNGEKFKVLGIKIFLDGALGSDGAALRDPYLTKKESKGLLLFDSKEIKEIISEAKKRKFEIAFHIIGDRALEEFLNGYESLNGVKTKIRLEHLQVTPDDLLLRLHKTNLTFSLQPTHYLSDKEWALKKLGEERFKKSYLLNSLIKNRRKVLFGTDFPIEIPDPERTINVAISRDDGEKISLRRTLSALRTPRMFRNYERKVAITFKKNGKKVLAEKMRYIYE
jgi:predicted amidohydrolase YtcJ